MDNSKKWYDNKLIVHLLLLFFFPVGLYALWKTSTIKKWWKVTASILVGYFALGYIAERINKSPQKSSAIISTVNNPQWVEVYKFSGSGMKKSPVFNLSGNNARIKYKYDSGDKLGVGLFSAYIFDKGVDILKEGGIPEVMTSKEIDNSESYIQKSAGEYYIYVNAAGNWTVAIEEEK